MIYIHTSGHGIRRDALGSMGGGDSICGIALAPIDGMDGGAYLTGCKLGQIIKNMV